MVHWLSVAVLLCLGVVALSNDDCRLMTHGMAKDATFVYRGEKGATFDNYEITPYSLSPTKKPLKRVANVGSLETCFQACVTTASCHSFTYTPTSCTLWKNYAVAADGSDGKNLAEFCRAKGSTAGYLGYNPQESDEDKQEKKNCGDDTYQAALDGCNTSLNPCAAGWSAVCDADKGYRCVCPL